MIGFGFSKNLKNSFDISTICEGDSWYCAPELLLDFKVEDIKNDPEKVNKCDVFSLGIILLEILA